MTGITATVPPVAAFAIEGGTLARAVLSLHRPDEWPEVLSVSQVADLLQAGRQTIRDAINAGEIGAVRIGGHQYRIPAESVWPLVPVEIREQWPEGRWRDAMADIGSSDTQEGEPNG